MKFAHTLRNYDKKNLGKDILAGLIILATMFLKQHSVIDVMGAVLMAYTLYQFVYATEKKKVPSVSRRREFG